MLPAAATTCHRQCEALQGIVDETFNVHIEGSAYIQAGIKRQDWDRQGAGTGQTRELGLVGVPCGSPPAV